MECRRALVALAIAVAGCGGSPRIQAAADFGVVADASIAVDAGLPEGPPPDGAIAIGLQAGGGGLQFDGIGAISGGGGNSRLLIDYPEPARSEILSYLFKPGAGAALQILKVEIGGDMNSTDGAEPSHSHTGVDKDYQRGYEWWLMEQARALNPKIRLYALSWGAPGWVSGITTIWTTPMINYIVDWLVHAKSDHGLDIDYIGGWNENGYDKAWYEQLKAALVSHGLTTKIVAADDGWQVADDLVSDATFRAAVDIIGAHYPCGGDGNPADTCGTTTANARATGMPLWASENGSQDFDDGAGAMARAMNRGYLDGATTAYINWPLVAAIPDNLPFGRTGLLVANQPWSGHYDIGKSTWVAAHTTQFAQPGWHYLDSGSGYLGGDRNAGSYVTLVAPNGSDFSVVAETTRATSPTTVAFTIDGLAETPIHVWSTHLGSSDSSQWFVEQPTLVPNGGVFWLVLQPIASTA